MILPKQVYGAEGDTGKLQSAVIECFQKLQALNPILNGSIVEASLTTADTAIDHKVGSTPSGWLVIGKDAEADVWESSTVNSRPRDQLILTASAAVNVTLYVF